MNIGVIIGRIGDVDGVALETEKWIEVLKRMGHNIFILSGQYTRNIVEPENETFGPMLSFFSPECEWEQKRAFFFPRFEDLDELLEQLEYASTKIAIHIFEWIISNRIDIILSENASALPCHLSLGMGIKKVVKNTNIKVVCHDHDFYWERGERYESPLREINDLVHGTFPLIAPNVKHAVINSYSKNILKEKFGIESVLVPNVMDFNKRYAEMDGYNRYMLDDIGLKEDDIPIFQATRIVRRKGIETAIELIERIKDKKVKLIITGSYADDERFGYYKELVQLIKDKGLNDRVFFSRNRILSKREKSTIGKKIYSLSDAYASARACTYFSKYEGFGNAFIEAVLAKCPIFVNNYKPVFWPDIGSKGFKIVMIEDNILTDEAVSEICEIIYNDKLRNEITEYNFELGKKHFSFEVLEEKLTELFIDETIKINIPDMRRHKVDEKL
ncbi:glycosyltransferase family 4 protein [Candidatus Dependentiae bacterium]|nr:glycosyltransferase family 4 protein [Candidatus Dependentiae bacterium]